MTLTYGGNVAGSIIGKLITRQGEVFEAVSATFEPELERTSVVFERVWSDDGRSAALDPFGELRVVNG